MRVDVDDVDQHHTLEKLLPSARISVISERWLGGWNEQRGHDVFLPSSSSTPSFAWETGACSSIPPAPPSRHNLRVLSAWERVDPSQRPSTRNSGM
jgi:hypothetical protein